jgi:hypothetical protein
LTQRLQRIDARRTASREPARTQSRDSEHERGESEHEGIDGSHYGAKLTEGQSRATEAMV